MLADKSALAKTNGDSPIVRYHDHFFFERDGRIYDVLLSCPRSEYVNYAKAFRNLLGTIRFYK